MEGKHTRMTAMIATLAFLVLAWIATPAWAVVPNPTVTGPIPENVAPGDPSHDYTFATSDYVKDFGYVEEEYFIEGTANVYSTPPLATGTVISSGHPYKTRIVVRRPANKARFNGTVILEWQNVTAGYDIDSQWVGGDYAHLMKYGYVWVGVSVQRVGVHQPVTGLRDWSPIRYGTLDVTDGGTILDDSLCYDIFSQAGQAIMHPVGVDPLHGLKPRRIIASGASQSASRLTVYYNSIHPLANLFDGYLMIVGGGPFRTDLGVPVFKVLTETDIAYLGGLFLLQPDSNILRTWQVAGAAHADRYFLDNVDHNDNRDGIATVPPGICTFPEGSELHLYYVTNAATDLLTNWVRFGIPPPTAPGLTILSPGPPTIIARDSYGLALGGIRIADIAVPTALNNGLNGGPSFCLLFGTHVPFDEATLDALYPSHVDYVKKVSFVTVDNVFHMYVLPDDGITTILDALHSDIGN
jgi:hypothetical protein